MYYKPTWCILRGYFWSPYPGSLLEVIETLLFLSVVAEVIATSVLLGGFGPTIPYSLVVTSRRSLSLSHPSHLVAALTKVTTLQYLEMKSVSITRVRYSWWSLMVVRKSLSWCPRASFFFLSSPPRYTCSSLEDDAVVLLL